MARPGWVAADALIPFWLLSRVVARALSRRSATLLKAGTRRGL